MRGWTKNMSFADRHNKVAFEVPFDTTDFEFKKCRELESNKVYTVYGYFASTGLYGKQYTLILKDFYLNLPKHMTPVLDDFEQSDIEEIKSGKVGVKRKDYTKNGKKQATVEWVDL